MGSLELVEEPPVDVTEAEQAVLEQLWPRAWATIRELTDELYPNGTASDFATVQKLLERLEKKGFAERQGQKGTTQFRAAVGREELIGRRLQRVVDGLCEGSVTPVLVHLVNSRKLSRDDLQSLQDLIEQLDSPASKSKGSGTKRKASGKRGDL